MQTYIGIKMVEATPAEDDAVQGYNIIDAAGYAHFVPKDEFERTYLPIKSTNTLHQDDIDQLMAIAQASDADSKTTLVRAELLTGFSLYETSSCVDEDNYDGQKGAVMAMAKVNSKVWFAMGFVLQWALKGLKNTPKITVQPEGGNDGDSK